MLKNIKTAGELQESRFVTGTITVLNHYLDSCSISIAGISYSEVPIFYHCNPDAVETDTGAIKGGSWGFAIGDKVIVLMKDSVPESVIGHKGGARPCVPCLMIFSTQSGAEVVVWDIINDEIIVEKTLFSQAVQTLEELEITNITECVNDLVVEQSYNYYDLHHAGELFYRTSDDLPKLHVEPVYELDITPCADFPFVQWQATMWGDTIIGYDGVGHPINGWQQPYFINPVIGKDDTPRVGMWIGHSNGTVQSDVYWNFDRWGDPPVSSTQEEDFGGISQQYYFFRSIFDHRFDFESFAVYPSNLFLGTSLLFEELVDGEYQSIYEINEDIWLECGYTQDFYDSYLYWANEGGYNLMVPHNPLIESATGLGVSGDSSLLFEWSGVYPNIYDFYFQNQIWTDEMIDKYKQEFRVFYRHPYFKKNFDKMLFNRVNKVREDLGLSTMEYNQNLQKAAQIFADDMAQRQSGEPAHIGSDGSKIGDRADAGGYGFYTHGPTYNQETIDPSPFEQVVYPLENAAVTSCGLPWHIHKIVDGSELEVPSPILSSVTNVEKDVEGDGWQIGHDKDGQEFTVTGHGWVNSPGHYGAMTYPPLLDSALASKTDNDGVRYISNTFGFISSTPIDETTTQEDNKNWAGFSTFNAANLLNYVMENFVFSKVNGDQNRVPKIYLCVKGE